ncbi:hypothetical protein J7X25_004602 [Vibrio parahaemolyticus]|nr:hypothetical protein [Vibrio parahaemolyticus]EKA7380066.1 hypothetical protein [Vibrio parahaemolyticus]
MKFVKKYILTVKLFINIAMLIALLSVILNDLIFFRLPELFDGASGLLTSYYNFCIGFVVSYIFYILVVHIKEVDDKSNMSEYILHKSKAVVGDHHSMVSSFKKAVGKENDDNFLSKAEFEDIFSKIDPQGPAPMVNFTGNKITWLSYLENYRIRSLSTIEKAFDKMQYMESKHVKLLTDIEECTHFMSIAALKGVPVRNDNLQAWASAFYDYSQLIKILSDYNETTP